MTIRYTLEQALARLSRIRLRRGRGTEALQQLLRRVRSGEVEIDETTRRQFVELLLSLNYAIEDLEAEARQNLRVTSRAIQQALRHGR